MSRDHNPMKDFAKQKFEYIQGQGAKLSKDAAESVGHYTRKKPWQAIGIASAIAGFFGFLLGRKSKRGRRR